MLPRGVRRAVPFAVVAALFAAIPASVGAVGSRTDVTPTTGPTGDVSTTTTPTTKPPVSPTAHSAQSSTQASTSDPIGYTMYAVDSSSFLLCNFLAVDLITGVGTVKNSVPVPCADGLTFSSTGKLYAFRFAPSAPPGPTALVTIDPATGAETVIGPVPHVFEAGMAFDGAGSLWLYGLASSSEPSCTTSGPKSCLWKIDPATGAATFVGGSNFLVQSLGGSCTQVVTVAKATPESQANLYQVNTATAALTSLAPVSGFQFATGLAYDRSGGLWAIGPSTDGSSVVVTRVGANGSTSPVTVTVNGAPFVKGGFGLAIDPLSCVINVIVVQPKFTG